MVWKFRYIYHSGSFHPLSLSLGGDTYLSRILASLADHIHDHNIPALQPSSRGGVNMNDADEIDIHVYMNPYI